MKSPSLRTKTLLATIVILIIASVVVLFDVGLRDSMHEALVGRFSVPFIESCLIFGFSLLFSALLVNVSEVNTNILGFVKQLVSAQSISLALMILPLFLISLIHYDISDHLEKSFAFIGTATYLALIAIGGQRFNENYNLNVSIPFYLVTFVSFPKNWTV